MTKSYFTVKENSVGIYEEKRSKFIANATHIKNEAEAKDIVLKAKKKYYDARHNTYAYVIGEDKKIQKFFDDGEPSGTAGKPIIDAIIKRDFSNIIIVVTRYFGGIKLGAAGLTRAYNKAANISLDNAKIAKMELFYNIEITVDYNFLSSVEYFLRSENILIKTREYGEKVILQILAEIKKIEEIKFKIIELSAGKITIKDIGEEFVSVDA